MYSSMRCTSSLRAEAGIAGSPSVHATCNRGRALAASQDSVAHPTLHKLSTAKHCSMQQATTDLQTQSSCYGKRTCAP